MLVEIGEENTTRKIKLLLIDCGFLDGEDLWWLHKRGTHYITRGRANMEVVQDMRSFRKACEGEGVYRQERGGVEIIGVEGLTTYDAYGDKEHTRKKGRKDFQANKINAVMVVTFRGKEYPEGKEPVFLTDLPVNKPLSILDKYDLRSLIENQGFREPKQGWLTNKFPVKKEKAVRAHAILTLLMYALNAAYQSEQGQEAVRKGVRRMRMEDFQSIHKIVVYSGDYFGIYDIEEYTVIIRSPPKDFVRADIDQTKKRLGLDD